MPTHEDDNMLLWCVLTERFVQLRTDLENPSQLLDARFVCIELRMTHSVMAHYRRAAASEGRAGWTSDIALKHLARHVTIGDQVAPGVLQANLDETQVQQVGMQLSELLQQEDAMRESILASREQQAAQLVSWLSQQPERGKSLTEHLSNVQRAAQEDYATRALAEQALACFLGELSGCQQCVTNAPHTFREHSAPTIFAFRLHDQLEQRAQQINERLEQAGIESRIQVGRISKYRKRASDKFRTCVQGTIVLAADDSPLHVGWILPEDA